nr:hypothetical protein [Tanacetum cinerariifolium]
MVNVHHKDVLRASTSKGARLLANDAEHDDNNNGSSSSFKDLNFRGFTDEETKVLSSMIRKQVGKIIKNVMSYYISQTTDNIKEMVRKELEEFKRSGIMSDFRNEMATYCDFTACDVPNFDGVLDPIASTRWLAVVEGAFRTSNCKEKNKVNSDSNFLRDSAKMWWEGKVCEKGEEWIGATIRRLTKPLDEPEKEFQRLRRAAWRLRQNESLAIAGRNLFDDEASSSNDTRTKPSSPLKTLLEHSHPNSSGFQNLIILMLIQGMYDGPEWVVRSKFEDKLANFMLEKKFQAKGIGEMLDEHRKHSRPPFPTPSQSTHANHVEGATEKGHKSAKSSIIQDEEAPWSSVFYQPSKSSNQPFPSRVRKQKRNDEDEQLLSIFKQIYINLPFLEAMIHMPKGAKVLKDLLSHKEKLEKAASLVKLSEESSAIIREAYPKKKETQKVHTTIACRATRVESPEKSVKTLKRQTTGTRAEGLPEHLEYAFLQENNKLLVVNSSVLSVVEKARLLEVLKNHKGAIAWSIADIKGIDSSFYTHKILMEDEFKPSVQPQRQVNPNIKEVVVLKKGGMTVVKNEKDELIPQWTVTG